MYQITNDENGSSLELTDAQFNDTGALTVSVITPFSDWQSTVSLHVIAAPTNGHSSNYCYTNSPLSKLVTNDVTDCNGHTGHSAQSSVVIVNSPESSDVLLGQKVSLVCQFKVISDDLAYRPEVNWNRAVSYIYFSKNMMLFILVIKFALSYLFNPLIIN